MATTKKLIQAAAGAGGGDVGAWDLSYAYYDGPGAHDLSTALNVGNISVATQDTFPTAVFFKPDGTKMYVLGDTNDSVYEYNLSTAWEVGSATYSQTLSVSTRESAPRGLFFKPDGTKMYITGSSGDDVNEYNLSTAWDISTASYSQAFSVSSEETFPTGVFFKPDGTKMYISGDTGNDINEYDLSTAWDVSTASYLQNFSVSTQGLKPADISFSGEGTEMYVLDEDDFEVNKYELSTAWDISSASYSQTFSFSAQDQGPRGLYVRSDGLALYMVGQLSDRVYQYVIGGFSVASRDTSPEGLFFKPDGTKMYIVGSAGDDVNEFNLSTAWDVSTASYLQNFVIASQEIAPTGVFFKPDGTKMYITGTSGDDVNEYDLSTAWDISTASYLQNFSVSLQESNPEGLFFKPDGTKMYIIGITGDDVNEYNLSTAWDITSASFVQNFSVASQSALPTGISFKDDGAKMYVIDRGADSIFEYDLSTAWDVSTASYSQSLFVRNQESNPYALFFKDDGTQLFIVGSGKDTVYSYTLGVQE